MKSIRKIAVYLSIVLLAFANLGAYGNDGGQLSSSELAVSSLSATISSQEDPLFCLTEQRSFSGSFHGGSSLPSKLPVSLGFARYAFSSAPTVSSFHYYHLSKHLLLAFEATDAIYPFHQFW